MSVFEGLYDRDIPEFKNVPYNQWMAALGQNRQVRIRRESEDDNGFEYLFRVGDGMILRVLDIQILTDNTVPVCKVGGYLTFTINLTGSSLIIFSDSEDYKRSDGCVLVSYEPDTVEFEDFCEAGVHFVEVQLLVARDYLQREFLGDCMDGSPQVLQPLFCDGVPAALETITMPLDIEAHQALEVLAAVDSCCLLRDRFIEAKATELTCLMIRSLLLHEKSNCERQIKPKEIELLAKARELFFADLASPPSVEELAQQLGIGKSTLLKRFKKFYGHSFRFALLQARMEKSKELLPEEDLSIDQIAWRLGYEHSCNFVTSFKNYYGMTPNAYRKLYIRG